MTISEGSIAAAMATPLDTLKPLRLSLKTVAIWLTAIS